MRLLIKKPIDFPLISGIVLDGFVLSDVEKDLKCEFLGDHFFLDYRPSRKKSCEWSFKGSLYGVLVSDLDRLV